MKTKTNVTLYQCDFCKKELKRKHSMQKHELECNCNPINRRPCLNECKYLERRKIYLGIGRDDYFTGEEITREYNGFYCALKELFLLHPKIEYRNEFIKDEVTYDDKENEISQESMPLSCEDYLHTYFFS